KRVATGRSLPRAATKRQNRSPWFAQLETGVAEGGHALQLRMRRLGEPARDVTIDGDVAVVGRSSDCDAILPDPHISKKHTRIFSGVVVLDLGSTNGTWVDDVRIGEATLVPGRRFRVGTGEHAVELEVIDTKASANAPEPDGIDATIVATPPSSKSATKEPAPQPPAAAAVVRPSAAPAAAPT